MRLADILRDMPKSDHNRSAEAVRLVREEGLSVAEACRRAGVGRTSYYARLRNEEEKQICPTCGQVVQPGHEVKK